MTWWLIFVSRAKMQLRQVNVKQNSLKFSFRVWPHTVRSRWVWWSQKSIQGHVWPSEVKMYMYVVKGWDMTLEVKTQLNVTNAPKMTSNLIPTHRDLIAWRHTLKLVSNCINFHWLGATSFFPAYKNSHQVIIDCHTPVVLQLGEDKMWIYLIKREFWSKPHT